MKIAYVSPMPPKKSGISDYSVELLNSLKKKCDIDVYVCDLATECDSVQGVHYHFLGDLPKKGAQYDHIVYHIGNNFEFHNDMYSMCMLIPGIIVLHDYSLHHLVAARYINEGDWDSYLDDMAYNHGVEGIKNALSMKSEEIGYIWESEDSMQYPMNYRLLEKAHAVITHSNFVVDLLKEKHPFKPVFRVPMICDEYDDIADEEILRLRKKYKIPSDKTVFASFGYASTHKRIDKIIDALRNGIEEEVFEKSEIFYLIVGFSDQSFDPNLYAKQAGISECFKYIGNANLNEFKDYIKLTDVCINLRFPTQGETSATLMRILGYGKPVIVTDIGSFSEIPDSCSIKIGHDKNEVGEILNSVSSLISDKKNIESMSLAAKQYIRDAHTPNLVGERYLEILLEVEEMISFKIFDSVIDSISDLAWIEPECVDLVSNAICELYDI